jgi:flagellar assembly protein FliH
MPAPQKYLFDVSFDAPDAHNGAADARFTRAELDAARAEGIEAGRAQGLAAAAAAAERDIAAALEAIVRGIAVIAAERETLTRNVESEVIGVLRTIVQSAVPALCRVNPLAELEAMVTRCLAEVLDEPRLVLRVSDALFDAMQQRVGAIAQSGGYAGKIVLLADDTLAPGDGRVEWADGGAERDTRRIAHDIDAFFARTLAAPAARPVAEEIHHG